MYRKHLKVYKTYGLGPRPLKKKYRKAGWVLVGVMVAVAIVLG